MKKYIKLLVLILTCISIYLIYENKNENKISYISLGDGFAAGINSFSDKNYGYSNYISDNLKEEGILKNSYLNFTSKDITINDLKNMVLLNYHDQEQNNIKQVLRETQLLTISVGINDLIYKINSENIVTNHQKEKILTEIVDKLDLTIQEIRKYYKDNIYLVGYYNFYPQNSVERKLLDELNNRYKEYSNKNNIIFVDNNNMEDLLFTYLDNPNNFYPNVYGYRKMANNIWIKMSKNEKTLEK